MPSQQEIDRQHFIKTLERASEIVSTWPEWKRNILSNSAKPMWDTPRQPVDNSDSYYRRKLAEATDECHRVEHRLHLHILERATTVIDTGVYE